MKNFILKAIRIYQKASFLHKPIFKTFFLTDSVCRFRPTCSDYTYQAIEKYGILKGSWIGIKRIVRCHPWARGGYEPLK